MSCKFVEEYYQSETHCVKSCYVYCSQWIIYFGLIAPVQDPSLSESDAFDCVMVWEPMSAGQRSPFGACISPCTALSCLKEIKVAEG